MDLNKLKWIKNVNNPEGGWVYKHEEVTYPYLVPEFHLHWKTTALENAKKPNPSDLILLCQRTRVTHLVKVLDDIVHDDSDCRSILMRGNSPRFKSVSKRSLLSVFSRLNSFSKKIKTIAIAL
jgi:hypothetical protein